MRVGDVATGLLCGLFFVAGAWWMATHEFWSTRDARRLAEERPSTMRSWNLRVDQFITKRMVPLALGALGAVTIVWAVARLVSL